MKTLEAATAEASFPAGRLALRPREAARALGIGERTLRQILPEIPHIHVGSAVLIPVDLPREWLRNRARTEQRRADQLVHEVLAEITPR